jgi:hypothetical protein
VKARDRKFYDFLNILFKIFFLLNISFLHGHRALAKNGQKKASLLFRAINKTSRTVFE